RRTAKLSVAACADAQPPAKSALSAPTGKAPNRITGTVRSCVRKAGPLQAPAAAYSAEAGYKYEVRPAVAVGSRRGSLASGGERRAGRRRDGPGDDHRQHG